eukprot:TRINITY_DN939_c0_g2_i1.p1 TRINITY_DN939_c0_g2~~TRINITY_DN939_c0_g2_i1.p1  ORF type:complete len:356 (+),score=88.07 TRINITY_DN939_c0_g2_i1:204-1271(+)
MADPLAELDFLLNELDNSAKPSDPPQVSIPVPQVNPVTSSSSSSAAPLGSNDSWKNELDDLLSELSTNPTVSSSQPLNRNASQTSWQHSAPLPVEDEQLTSTYVPPSFPASSAPRHTTQYNEPVQRSSSVSSSNFSSTQSRPVVAPSSSVPVHTPSISFAPLPIEFSAGGSVPLSREEQNLIQELNHARTNPSAYADILERDRKPYFENGKHLKLPGTNVLLVTEEGVNAVNDAIHFLRSQAPLPPFKVSAGMVNAAKEAIAEVGPVGETSCESIRRFDNYGRFEQEAVEIASFGTSDSREIVLRFIVCDGQPDRIQRSYIYEPIYSCVGFSIGEHKSAYRTMACINFTKGFIPK